MFKFLKTAIVASVLCTVATPAFADMSPNLLIVSQPSDNPLYRRMVVVKYLAGTRVSANYKAYNRREFINTPSTTSGDIIAACARGKRTSLGELKAFKKSEARLKRSGKTPETRTFCIKGISNWTDQNKDKYLDPIFDGMPYLAK
ncbi:MAG: hypothetical protein COA43_10265 [Robiginitomaculum sp.]|nr:MAG: hypothetical protein COA43_10265 [Robiginitomaculum sp.]